MYSGSGITTIYQLFNKQNNHNSFSQHLYHDFAVNWSLFRSCFQNATFFENVSRFKARHRKSMRFTKCIVQVGMRLCKKKKKNVQY